ncbi:nuclear pore membrane glycoprotein 210-like [Discoglossus pictus]
MSHSLCAVPLFLALWASVIISPTPGAASKLSAPKVLLPYYQELNVKFVLGAEDGCYTWSTSRPDVVNLTPIHGNNSLCSQKVVLTAQSIQPRHLSSVVTAEENVTGRLLRCDVIVDVIRSIEILSRSRELYVEASPVELTVRALDEKGNTFSSLAGIRFEWVIGSDENMGEPEASSRVRILKYSEAEYSPPEHISIMERDGQQGDMVLVSGIHIGVSVIRVRIRGSYYKFVPTASVRLIVLENMFLTPHSDVFLLVGAEIRFQMEKLVHGKRTGLLPPLDHYEAQLESGVSLSEDPQMAVAHLDETSVTVTALQPGTVTMVFVHKRFSIHPGDRWILEEQRVYEVTMEVYEKSSSMRVHPSHNLRIDSTFPGGYFSVLFSSDNGSYHIVQTKQPGTTTIWAALVGVELGDGSLQKLPAPLSHNQEVRIFQPIVLTPQTLAFPNYPPDMTYRYSMLAEGGSGSFTWVCTNQSVATITTQGILITGPVGGLSHIQARDALNPINWGESQVHMLHVSGLELLPVHTEARVGQEIHVPMIMYGGDMRVPFTDCTLQPLHISTDKQGVFGVLEGTYSSDPPSCSCLVLLAQAPGHILLTVRARTEDGEFHSEVTLSAYEPLKSIDPVHRALLTIYSAKKFVFEGGPHPWLLEPARFFMELKAQNENSVQIHLIGPQRKINQYMYWVQCMELGEQDLTFTLGYHPGVHNPNPSVEMVHVQLICAPPASMSVYPVYTMLPGAQPCPLSYNNKQIVSVRLHVVNMEITVSSTRETLLELTIYDQHRRKFDNFSSLLIEWTSSNETLAQLSNHSDMHIIQKGDGSGQMWLHGQQMLEVHSMKGTVYISINCMGYKDWVPQESSLVLPISTLLELSLVDDVLVTPQSAAIFNHPKVNVSKCEQVHSESVDIEDNHQEVFQLVEGSGYFLVSSSDPEIVNITYQETESTVQMTPLQAGSLTLSVYDLCLPFPGPALASVQVSDVWELDLDLIDKVELGKSTEVTLRVLDASGRQFLNKYFSTMRLDVLASAPIVSLMRLQDYDEFSWCYLLRAITVGQTTLVVTAYDKTGRKITSPPQPIKVFTPFRLVPDKMTLIIQNMIQVMSEGGPQPQSIIHFTISNDSVATVNQLGQVTGLAVGTATVTGTIQGLSEDTGKVLVFSQDEMVVEVIELRAIRIHVPVTRLVTGTQMPVYVMGLSSSQTPFSFSNSKLPLHFHWSLSKRDIVTLEPSLSEVSLQLHPENNFAQMIQTKAAGRTSIKVTVRSVSTEHFEGNVTELSDQVQILVFQCLSFISPECPSHQILVSPNSQLPVLTNREGGAAITTFILQSFPNSSVIEDNGHGQLKAGSITGLAILQITALEPDGVTQTVVTAVQVAPISYLRISASPRLYTKEGVALTSVPLGMTITLTIHFYSSIGERFHAHNAQLCLSMNRDDLLLIEPGVKSHTYMVQAVNLGVTLLAVWDQKQPGMAHYIPVPVEHAVYPDLGQPCNIGEVICFSTSLVDNNGESGNWKVSPGETLQVDGGTGAAVALNEGSAIVFYVIPGMVTTYREVLVKSANSLIVNFGPQSHLTNTPGSADSHLIVTTNPTGSVLRGPCSPAQLKVIKAKLTPEDNLVCSVVFSNQTLHIPASSVFHARPVFNVEAGLYVCVISVRPLSNVELQAMSTIESQVEVIASLLHQGGRRSLLIPFYPAFQVNQTQLMVSSQSMRSEIQLYGTSDVIRSVQIIPGFPGVSVGLASPFPHIPGLVIFPVLFLNLHSIQLSSVPLFINITCPLTGQNVALPVTTNSKRPSTQDLCEEPEIISQLLHSSQAFLLTVFAVLASSVMIFLGYTALQNRAHSSPVIYLSSGHEAPGYNLPPSSYQNQMALRGRHHTKRWLWSTRYYIL